MSRNGMLPSVLGVSMMNFMCGSMNWDGFPKKCLVPFSSKCSVNILITSRATGIGMLLSRTLTQKILDLFWCYLPFLKGFC